MITDIVALILEIIGTIAFSVSGAMAAIRAKLDVFGVVIVGCITACGGGILRDVLIGSFPPAIFSNFKIVMVGTFTALMVFTMAYRHRKRYEELTEKIEYVNNVFDAIGLAAFTVMGTELAFTAGIHENIFLALTMGVLTGVGGGVIRDVLINTTPYIFKKHIYALASLSGGVIYYAARLFTVNPIVPSLIAMALVISLRLLAAKYRWSLPKVS
ncbi:MAG: trimeric intracellular cation channel family protein [Clostridia bacterium]|nr:trimeric intracellular cation channel family protein [Clostridia bacterium]